MLKDAVPPSEIGKVFGFVSSGLAFGSALTPVPFGYLIDNGYGQWVLVIASIILVASIFCMGTARASGKSQAALDAEAAEARRRGGVGRTSAFNRHCERSDEQSSLFQPLDCFASLAMTLK